MFNSSPKLFAVYHVLLRLQVPRHPPCALEYLIIFLITFSQGNFELLSLMLFDSNCFSSVSFETVAFLPLFYRKKPSFQRSFRLGHQASRLCFPSGVQYRGQLEKFYEVKHKRSTFCRPELCRKGVSLAVASFRPAFSLRR